MTELWILSHLIADDNLLFEGDIAMSKQELSGIEKNETFRRKRNAVHKRKALWTSRRIPYYIDPGLCKCTETAWTNVFLYEYYQFWIVFPRGSVRIISNWCSVSTGWNLNQTNFIYTGQLYQFFTVFPWGPVRIISHWSSVTTGRNLN